MSDLPGLFNHLAALVPDRFRLTSSASSGPEGWECHVGTTWKQVRLHSGALTPISEIIVEAVCREEIDQLGYEWALASSNIRGGLATAAVYNGDQEIAHGAGETTTEALLMALIEVLEREQYGLLLTPVETQQMN